MQHLWEPLRGMYLDVDWLQPSDRYILEFMTNCDSGYNGPAKLTPKVIGLNTTVSRKHAGARCRVLADKGLVDKIDRGVYRITELGEQFVRGELEPEQLRKL